MLPVADIDWKNTKIVRGGIIPYYDYPEIRLYAFSIENGSGSLCDFGGHIEPEDNDLLDAIIREYYEESFGVFGKYTREEILTCKAMAGTETYQILVPSKLNPRDTINLFRQKLKHIQPSISHEVQGIVWLSKNQIYNIISIPNQYQDTSEIWRTYWRLQEALRNCYDDLI